MAQCPYCPFKVGGREIYEEHLRTAHPDKCVPEKTAIVSPPIRPPAPKPVPEIAAPVAKPPVYEPPPPAPAPESVVDVGPVVTEASEEPAPPEQLESQSPPGSITDEQRGAVYALVRAVEEAPGSGDALLPPLLRVAHSLGIGEKRVMRELKGFHSMTLSEAREQTAALAELRNDAARARRERDAAIAERDSLRARLGKTAAEVAVPPVTVPTIRTAAARPPSRAAGTRGSATRAHGRARRRD